MKNLAKNKNKIKRPLIALEIDVYFKRLSFVTIEKELKDHNAA